MKLDQLIIRKFIKIIATRCHVLRLKCTKLYSWRLSVRPSVRKFVRCKLHLRDGRTDNLSVRLLDGVSHIASLDTEAPARRTD